MEEKLTFEIRDRVARITINRERRRNALDDDTLGLLRDALDRSRGDDVGAIVLRGAGLKAFSAGSDIKELAAQSHADKLAHTERGHVIADAIEQHPRPVIAAIEGYCLGGGLEIALACDYRVAGAAATLGLPEVTLNALPSWGGTFRLPRIVGAGRARELALFGRQLTAAEALDWGIVNRVVPEGGAFDAGVELATRVARDFDPAVVSILKSLLTHGATAPTPSARQLELLADRSVLASEALQSGVGRFVERGK